MATTIPASIQAQLYALAISKVTGETPSVQTFPDGHAELNFTSEQSRRLRAFLENRLAQTGGKERVKINAQSILVPIALKKSLPILAAIFGAGFLTALLIKR